MASSQPVALVTGGGSGIGRAACLAFADQGCTVVVAARSEDKGKETVQMIKDKGGQAAFVRCDVSEEEDVKQMVAFCKDTFGRLDYAFNNAGVIAEGNYIHEASLEEFDKVVSVNVRGVYACIKHEVPLMVATSDAPAIVVTGSVSRHVGQALNSIYSLSKWAVRGLVATAAKEYGRMGLRINDVSPGWVATAMPQSNDWKSMMLKSMMGPQLESKKKTTDAPAGPDAKEAAAAKADKMVSFTKDPTHTAPDSVLQPVPMGRVAAPEEVAKMVVWLCKEGTYVIGTRSFSNA